MPREVSTALKTTDKQIAQKRLREFVRVKEEHVRGTGVNLDRLISEIGWLTLEDITAA